MDRIFIWNTSLSSFKSFNSRFHEVYFLYNSKKLTPRSFFFTMWTHRAFVIHSVLRLDKHWVDPTFFAIGSGNVWSVVTFHRVLHCSFFGADSGKENVKVYLWNDLKFSGYKLLPINFVAEFPCRTGGNIAVHYFPNFFKWSFFFIFFIVELVLCGVHNAIIFERLENTFSSCLLYNYFIDWPR